MGWYSGNQVTQFGRSHVARLETINPLHAKIFNWFFTHLCLDDAIHNFKWVEII